MRRIATKILPFLIVGGSVLVGFFVLGRSDTRTASLNTKSLLGAQDGQTITSDALRYPVSPQATLNSPQGLISPTDPLEAPATMTDAFARAIAEQIIKSNPEGPLVVDGKPAVSLDAVGSFLDKLLAGEAKDIELPELTPRVETSKLNIVKGENRTLGSAYLIELAKILDRHQRNLQTTSRANGTKDFIPLALSAAASLRELYQMKVPVSFLPWHERMIELLSSEKSAFDIIAHGDKDPLKALLAIQSLRKTNEEFLASNKDFQKLLRAQ